MFEKFLQIGNALLHLDVALFIFELIFLEQAVAAPVLYYIRMRIKLELAQQLNFLPKNILAHVIFEPDFFHTFDVALVILDLVDIAVSPSDDSLPLDSEFLIQLPISTDELSLFIHIFDELSYYYYGTI